ncbi:hypothetical protein Nmel_007213 [Mimus melanotis]
MKRRVGLAGNEMNEMKQPFSADGVTSASQREGPYLVTEAGEDPGVATLTLPLTMPWTHGSHLSEHLYFEHFRKADSTAQHSCGEKMERGRGTDPGRGSPGRGSPGRRVPLAPAPLEGAPGRLLEPLRPRRRSCPDRASRERFPGRLIPALSGLAEERRNLARCKTTDPEGCSQHLFHQVTEKELCAKSQLINSFQALLALALLVVDLCAPLDEEIGSTAMVVQRRYIQHRFVVATGSFCFVAAGSQGPDRVRGTGDARIAGQPFSRRGRAQPAERKKPSESKR